MSLIAMAVYDTVENGRTEYTYRTLKNFFNGSINWDKHRLVVIDNNSCEDTKEILHSYASQITLITLEENVGTAKAINMGWALRNPGEHVIKVDNDVEIHHPDWADEMEEVLNLSKRLPVPIGILGLKRKDLFEDAYRNDGYRSELVQIPHEKGERWYHVEMVNHVMGTCQMYSSDLIDKIGGLEQMGGLYGFDDSIASVKSQLAGFKNAFLSHVNIDHIDKAENKNYQQWKSNYANDKFAAFHELVSDYQSGVREMFVPLND